VAPRLFLQAGPAASTRQAAPKVAVEFPQQSLTVGFVNAQRCLEGLQDLSGLLGIVPPALHLLDKLALPSNVLNAALDVLFGTSKELLNGGPIHLHSTFKWRCEPVADFAKNPLGLQFPG
jgi:hypothetical protein